MSAVATSSLLPAANPRDIKSLDQLRTRLVQLTNMLASLRRDLEIGDPLPSWYHASAPRPPLQN